MPALGDGGTLLPASIGTRLDPTYPWEARRNRWQGTVLLAVTVSPEGRPVAIDIVRSSGYGVLDEAAVEAVRQWRFVPARRNGVAVEDRVAVPITFRLRD
ncbi:MAG: energy transducer TonB [Elioraea sp.]|nr:energy transducer TonB [Elioraea sp.]